MHSPDVKYIDLTLPLNEQTEIYRNGSYLDPPFSCKTWSSLAADGFLVSQISMGTQSGTHIDAPSHFLAGAPTLDILPVGQLIGNYFLLDLSDHPDTAEIQGKLSRYAGEKFLLLRTISNTTSTISQEALLILLALPNPVLVLAGEICIDTARSFAFYQELATSGKFLVENLDLPAARTLPEQGELFIAPLRLTGTSGSPCRVIARVQVISTTSPVRK